MGLKHTDLPHTLQDQLQKLQDVAVLQNTLEMQLQRRREKLARERAGDQDDIDFALRSDAWKSTGDGQ